MLATDEILMMALSRRYRYQLARAVVADLDNTLMVCMLNPSTADEETDDEKAKAACNLAIAAALGSRDPVVIAERDRVCGE